MAYVQNATVDAEGAVRAYLNGYPGLTGKGNPLPNGVHLGDPRSPSAGAIAGVSLPTRTVDDTVDAARVSVAVKAVGSEEGARVAALRGARAVADAIHALASPGRPPATVVTTKAGELVRLVTVDNVQGPVLTGDIGGEITYSVDATFVCQPG